VYHRVLLLSARALAASPRRPRSGARVGSLGLGSKAASAGTSGFAFSPYDVHWEQHVRVRRTGVQAKRPKSDPCNIRLRLFEENGAAVGAALLSLWLEPNHFATLTAIFLAFTGAKPWNGLAGKHR
jgi:hypothetical protein